MTVKIKRKIYFATFWVVLITSFVFFATLLLLLAYGYHLNRQNFHLEKTGMIILYGPQSNLDISLNGTTKITNLPMKYKLLFPGQYQVTANKDGYSTWQKSIQLKGGQAVTVGNLILYSLSPVISNLGNDSRVMSNINSSYNNQKSGCVIKNDELWLDNKLITRFSQSPVGAIYNSSQEHFYVQVGNEIRVLDSDGRNDIAVIKLPDANLVIMQSNNNILSYIVGGVAYSAQLW